MPVTAAAAQTLCRAPDTAALRVHIRQILLRIVPTRQHRRTA